MINLYFYFFFISRFLVTKKLLWILSEVFVVMEKNNLQIRLEDELIKKLIHKAKEEGIAFEHYLIKTLKKAVNNNNWSKRNL